MDKNLINNYIKHLYKTFALLESIVQLIAKNQGIAILVGGAVRDLLLQKKTEDYTKNISISNDLDIEIYHISLSTLISLLSTFGRVIETGKSFGVLQLQGLHIDWSIPRHDSKGRKPVVTYNPNMSYKEAFERRDVTMNAIGINLMTQELIDPFNGKQDIDQKILRTPNKNKFIEDPLRLFRIMQFISRFAMHPDAELESICKTMSIDEIAQERITIELKKMLLLSNQPSLGLRWLQKLNRLTEIMPEIAILIDIPQSPHWHPEGNVFEHSMQALDAAALITKSYNNNQQRLLMLYATLYHDVGKASTTQTLSDGRITSHGHAHIGALIAQKALKKLTGSRELADLAKKLIYQHMTPGLLVTSQAKLSRYKRLAFILGKNLSIRLLADLAMADRRGRNAQDPTPLIDNDKDILLFLQKSIEADVADSYEKSILHGTDIAEQSVPGPLMGKILTYAYELQIEQNILDKDLLKKAALAKYKKTILKKK